LRIRKEEENTGRGRRWLGEKTNKTRGNREQDRRHREEDTDRERIKKDGKVEVETESRLRKKESRRGEDTGKQWGRWKMGCKGVGIGAN
jgi:hypothetical protein